MNVPDEFTVADALAYNPHQMKNPEYVAALIARVDDRESVDSGRDDG